MPLIAVHRRLTRYRLDNAPGETNGARPVSPRCVVRVGRLQIPPDSLFCSGVWPEVLQSAIRKSLRDAVCGALPSVGARLASCFLRSS